MSRWDALNPDNQSPSPSGGQWNRKNSSRRKGSGNGRRSNGNISSKYPPQPSTLKKRMKSSNNASETEKESLATKEEYTRLVSMLSCDSDSISRLDWIKKLANCILRASSSLVSCNLAQEACASIFLPFLQTVASNNRNNNNINATKSLDRTQEPETVLRVLQALEWAMSDSIHRAKLLLASVVEVTDCGREKLKPNDVRLGFLEVFQTLLRQEIYIEPVVKCLLQSLQSTKALEGTQKHALETRLDVDPELLYQFYERSSISCHTLPPTTNPPPPPPRKQLLLQHEHDKQIQLSLELLQALVQRHPEASSQLVTLLLQPNHARGSLKDLSSRRPPCRVCGFCIDETSPVFFQQLHSKKSTQRQQLPQHLLLVTSLSVEILDHVSDSLHKWLPQHNKATLSHQHRAVGRVSTFQDRICQGLQAWMAICRCQLQDQHNPQAFHHISLLAGTLLRRIPFDHQDQGLLDEGMRLATALVEGLLSHEQRHCQMGGQSSRPFASSRQQAARNHCTEKDGLLKAAGGTETSDGTFLEMTLPLQKVLNSSYNSGRNDKRLLLKLLRAVAKCESSSAAQSFLKAIVRTHPHPFLVETDEGETLWNSLMQHVFDLEKERIDLMASFLEGRQQFADIDLLQSSSDKVVKEILPRLCERLSGRPKANSDSRTHCLSCFGALTVQDWDWLIRDEEMQCGDHWQAILHNCEPTSPLKVRKVAFKALGDVVTNYFSCDTIAKNSNQVHTHEETCGRICRVLMTGLEQQQESDSCSMALFAVGNLVRVLKEIENRFLDPYYEERFAAVLLSFCDTEKNTSVSSDPKLATNAIRALGHLMSLVYRDGTAKISSAAEFLKQSLELFERLIRQSIALARREMTCTLMNAKDRSTVKKLGWGACFALSSVLPVLDEASTEVEEECQYSMKKCLQALVDCLKNLDTLNEKVGIAAMSTLCSMELSGSRIMANPVLDQETSLGYIVLQCLHWKDAFLRAEGHSRALSLKTERQLDVLLLHLLVCCTVADAEAVLSAQLLTRDGSALLGFLFDWLQEQRTKDPGNVLKVQSAFDIIALAMMKRTDCLSTTDVQLEQKFLGQTTRFDTARTRDYEDDEL